MNMNTNDEFLKAFLSMELIPASEIEYRLHYDNVGFIYMCSQSDHPDNQQYLVVTRDEYERYFDYTVVNGKLKKIDRTIIDRVKLKSSDQGYRVVKHHAGLILEEEYIDIEYYCDAD